MTTIDDVVNTLKQYDTTKTNQIDSLTNTIAAGNAANESQRVTIADLNRQIGVLTAEKVVLQAEIARLEALLDPTTPPPPPPPSKTLIGSSAGSHTWAVLTQKSGRQLDIRRSYDTQPTNFMNTSAGKDVGQCASWNSTKLEAQDGTSYYKTIPPGHTCLQTEHHEWNPDISVAVFKANQIKARKNIDAANAYRKTQAGSGLYVPIRFGPVHMMQDIIDGSAESAWIDGIWDFVGVDGYSWYSPIRKQPAALYAPALAFAKKHNLPLAIGETGSPANNPTNGNNDGARVGTLDGARAKWIADAVKWARDNNLMAWCYWDQSFAAKPQFTLISDAEFKALGS